MTLTLSSLQIKRAALERALVKVVNIIKHNYARGAFTADMEKMAEGSQGCICPLVDMKPSVSSLATVVLKKNDCNTSQNKIKKESVLIGERITEGWPDVFCTLHF